MANTALEKLLVQDGEPLARNLAQKLKQGQERISVPGLKIPLPKNDVLEEIKKWARQQYPLVFSADYFSQTSYSDQKFLTDLAQIKTAMPSPEESKQLSQAAAQASRPSVAQLKEWEALQADLEKQQHESWMARKGAYLELEKNPETIQQLLQLKHENLNLAQQLELIRNFQNEIEQAVAGQLDPDLPPEIRSGAAKSMAESYAKDVITLHNQKVEINLDTSREMIDNICAENLITDIALPGKNKFKLAELLSFASQDKQKLAQITQVQNNQHQAKMLLAGPIHETRKNLGQALQEKLGLSPNRAKKLIQKLESKGSGYARPTLNQLHQIIQESTHGIGLRDYFKIRAKAKKEGTTVVALLASVNDEVDRHLINLQLPQLGPDLKPLSQEAIKWTEKLEARGITDKLGKKIDPRTLEYLLRGFTPENIKVILMNPPKGMSWAERIKLTEVYRDLVNVETKKLPRRLKKRTKKFRETAERYNFWDKINPFSLNFWKHRHPIAVKYLEEKIEFIKKYTPGALIGRFKAGALSTWTKFAKKIINLKFIDSNSAIKRFARRALISLPKKLSETSLRQLPKLVLKPAIHFIRKEVAEILLKAAVRLGLIIAKDTAAKITEAICVEGIKDGVIYGAIAAAGLPTGVVTVAAIAIGAIQFVIDVVRDIVISIAKTIITTPGGRAVLKKALAVAGQLALGAFLFVYHLIAGFLPVIIGGSIGYFLAGAPGILLGGGLGFAAGKGLAWLGQSGLLAGKGLAVLSGISQAATGVAMGIGGILGPAAAFPVVFGTITLVSLFKGKDDSAFVLPAGPPEIEAPLESQYLIVNKAAQPTTVTANTEVSYTITITSGAEQITDIRVVDVIDTVNLENISVASPGVINGNQINWPSFDLSGSGSQQVFSYTAKTKSSVTEETKIANKVSVTALVDGETITRTASVTLNSDASEIVQRALEIVQNLQKGFWDFYNLSPDYPELFDWDEYNCCPNHCYRSSNYPAGCTGNPDAIFKAEAMFWCSWLVVKSYNETGHNFPTYLGVGMIKSWLEDQGKFLSGNTNVSQLELGDTILFTAPSIENPGSTYWAHIGIVCGLENRNDYITVCESNNYAPINTYTVSGGKVQGQGRLSIGGFGKP